MASRFLATIRVPAAPTEEDLAALAVLVTKADETNVGLFLSTGNSFDQNVRNTVLSLFSSLPVSRHPLKPFASFITEIVAEAKRSPDMALALLTSIYLHCLGRSRSRAHAWNLHRLSQPDTT